MKETSHNYLEPSEAMFFSSWSEHELELSSSFHSENRTLLVDILGSFCVGQHDWISSVVNVARRC